MDGDKKIAEDPRGVFDADQNLEPNMIEIMEEKLKEFGTEADRFKKKSSDMKRLTEIEDRRTSGEEFTKDDLRFLYEIDEKIKGFGYAKDPRIEEMLEGRDIKEDISSVTGFSKEGISTTKEEALSGNIKFHYGYLDLSGLTSAEGLKLPESVGGYLSLSGLTSAEGLKLPESVVGYLFLKGLTSADKQKLSEKYPQHADKIK